MYVAIFEKLRACLGGIKTFLESISIGDGLILFNKLVDTWKALYWQKSNWHIEKSPRSPLTTECQLFAFGFAKAVFVVFAVNAFVVLPDDKAAVPGSMLKRRGFVFQIQCNRGRVRRQDHVMSCFIITIQCSKPEWTSKGENLR